MSEANGLPKGWCHIPLRSICEVQGGFAFSSKDYREDGIPLVRIGNLTQQAVELMDNTVFLPNDYLSQFASFALREGDVLIALSGATTGKTAVYRGTAPALLNQRVGRFCFLDHMTLDRPFTVFLVETIKAQVVATAYGAAQPNISPSQIEQFIVAIPPIPEQRRIVAKIEELFSDLDAGVAALERAKANLKRYRAAVLKAAVEGKLTADWRNKQKKTEPAAKLLECIVIERRQKWEADQLAKFAAARKEPPKNWKAKYIEPAPPDTNNLAELPEGWCWASVQQVGSVQLGRQRSPKNRSNKFPTKYIRAANLTEAGLDLSDVLDMEFLPREMETYRLHPGDVLLSEASGSPDQVGKPVVWNGEIEDCCFQNTVIRLRPEGIPSEYPLTVFRHYYRSKLFAKVSAGVGINHLSAAKFSVLPFPLAPLNEQKQIVFEVEAHLSLIAAAEQQIEADLLRAARLRQSILKRAFEGKLVPQDPNDEPASALLERIAGEGNGRLSGRATRNDESRYGKSRLKRKGESR